MTKREDLRHWVGDNAAGPDIDEVRLWVVWGDGNTVPKEIAFEGPGNDIAEGIARAHDPQWAERPAAERWYIILRADEDDVDSLVAETAEARGFAPYLAEGMGGESMEGYLKGSLRSDVAPRRKAEPWTTH